jgi:drug/metabolite transporter (DMT)-like permease
VTAVLLALAAALAFATGTVVQHRVAADSPTETTRGSLAGLLRRLLRHPAWLAGQGAAAVGVLLHAAALRSGQVVVVQPLLSAGLVLALGIGAIVDRRHPDRPLPDRGQWAAAALVAVGLAVFLVAAHPSAGQGSAPSGPLTACVVGSLVVAGLAALWGRRPEAPHRALVLGIAAGVGFGMTGLVLKDVVSSPLGNWPAVGTVLELITLGAVSVLMAQWAYHAGPLIESLPVTTVLEPCVALALSGPLFGEWLAPGALARTGQILGVLALITGVVLLARRAASEGNADDRPRSGVVHRVQRSLSITRG